MRVPFYLRSGECRWYVVTPPLAPASVTAEHVGKPAAVTTPIRLRRFRCDGERYVEISSELIL